MAATSIATGRYRGEAFTLIELMITIAIVGVLASVGVPAYTHYINETKTAEAYQNIGSIYRLAAAYWESDRSGQGIGASKAGHCIVGSEAGSHIAPPLDAPPTASKRTVDFSTHPGFRDLGFQADQPLYFSYAMLSRAIQTNGGCQIDQNGPPGSIYTFFAIGDMDGDSKFSILDLSVGYDAQGQIYKARAINYRPVATWWEPVID